jgi:hypothetical protein
VRECASGGGSSIGKIYNGKTQFVEDLSVAFWQITREKRFLGHRLAIATTLYGSCEEKESKDDASIISRVEYFAFAYH